MQARWLLTASAHLPIPAAALGGHFDRRFMSQVSASAVNGALAGVGAALPGSGRVRLDSVEVDEPRLLVATLARGSGAAAVTVSLQVDGAGLISGLLFKPLTVATPTSWPAIDAAVRSVAPRVRMLVADTTGDTCRPIHAIDAGVPAPLGSAFKLYVLDALGSAVASGRAGWDQALTITSGVKSLPSGDLRLLPNGTRVSVREAADKMISISDNTAADMLIGLLGRGAVEATLFRAVMADPARDIPFLTTRELFILKLDGWPSLAARYARADLAARRALLAAVDRRGLPPVAAARAWTAPRAIDDVEWFASADDLCRVYTALSALSRRPGLRAIGGALSLNDGALGLDPWRWSTTWFKGGSEPGVLTLTYQAKTRTGRTYFVAVLAGNRTAPIEEATAEPRLLAATQGGVRVSGRLTGRELHLGVRYPPAAPPAGMRSRRQRHRPISDCAPANAQSAGYPPACCLSTLLAPETQTLYGVPRAPATCFRLSFAHALAGLLVDPLASLAMSVTHNEKGVPRVPATCCLLSPWQNLP